ncbi:MAG: hypothetical protein ACYC1D_06060 [Acidimicrobiales bacterium]
MDRDRSLHWPGWRFPLVVSAVTILACVLFSIILPGLLDGAWLMSHDVWWTVNSAQWVSHGAIGTVYQANPWYSALPGFPALLAPLVALGDHLHLSVGYPFALPTPTMWLLVGPFFFLCCTTATLGVDVLGATLGIARRRRRMLVVGVSAFVVFPTAVVAGHPEDLLTLALVCVSLALLLRQRHLGAALLLSVAIVIQTWAGLLLPLFVMAMPPGLRLRSLWRAAALPSSFGVLLLALDWRHASRDLLKQPMVNRGQRLPWWSLAHHMTVTVGRTTETAVMGSTSRSLAVVAALLVAVWLGRHVTPQRIMTAVAVVLLARGVFEVEVWPYYLAPAAIMLATAVAFSAGPCRRRWRAGASSALVLCLFTGAAYQGISLPTWPMFGVLLLTGGIATWCSRGRALNREVPCAAPSPAERSERPVGASL